MGRFLDAFKPIARFMPEVKPPVRKVGFSEKLFWTGLVLVIYLVMCEVPLYGIPLYGRGVGYDPFFYMRVILAAKRGTLMELGIGPIVTAGLILQLLAGSRIIQVDFSKPADRGLFTSANKFFAIIMTLFEASAYLFGGAYGQIKPEIGFLICLQLLAAGIILILLDEMLQKGWGIGSGISLFIAAGVAQTIWWYSFAPVGPMSDHKYFGALVAFAQGIMQNEYVTKGWWNLIHRPENLPDMLSFIATVAIFLVVMYFEGMRVEIPIAYARFRGFRGKFPVKLLYVSNIPVILASALFADVYFISQICWSKFNPDNKILWFNLLGTFNATSTQPEPIGGLAYYMTPPRSVDAVVKDPVKTIIYISILLIVCVIFSMTWVQVSGLDSKTVAKQLVDSGMQIPGFRRSEKPIQELLNRYIPAVTVLGGLTVGLIAAFGDVLNAFGGGTGILLTAGILFQYYQILVKERITEMYPGISKFLGK
ncbi:preprotein translocase subunit SecY [Candidatus Bathyarchaeota archaeon]|nr:preprotein translocase subunit SecY [Candidatus Bathyarchaeota archaeon]